VSVWELLVCVGEAVPRCECVGVASVRGIAALCIIIELMLASSLLHSHKSLSRASGHRLSLSSCLRGRKSPSAFIHPNRLVSKVHFSQHKSNAAGNEAAFILLRLIFRSSGQIVSALYRSGLLRPKQLLIFSALPITTYGALLLWKGETIPYSNRRHLVWLSDEEEEKLSAEARQQVLGKENKKLLPDTAELFQTTERISNDILRICKEDGIIRKNLRFEVHVIDAPIPNAFVLPDGSIFVYTGIRCDLF
jgi:hypothetical protein